MCRPPARRSASLWCWWCKGLFCLETKKNHQKKIKTTIRHFTAGRKKRPEVTVDVPVATERTSNESSFTRGLKDVLLSPLTPPPPPSQRDGYRSCNRSSGPLWRRTRQSDSSSAWISEGKQRRVSRGAKRLNVCLHQLNTETDRSAYPC